MATILVKGGRVWDGDNFFNSDILIEGNKITKIEPSIIANATCVYDATGKTVSAGLVDIHTHLRVTGNEPYAIQGEMACFPFGVTAAADAGRYKGERMVLDSFMLKNVIFAGTNVCENHADLNKLKEIIDRFGDKTVGVKVYFDANVSQVSDVTPLAEFCSFAHANGLRVMVHCSGSPTPMKDILATLGHGDILTHSFHGGIHTAAEDGFESMREAKARGVVIDAGFAGHVHTDFSIFRTAVEQGVLPDVISTDITKFSAYTRGGRYGMTMCMSIARHVGMSEADIFRAATSTPAKVIGKDEWGTLRVGGIADLAVFDYTNESFDLTDKAGNRIKSDKGYRCLLTISDGQIVYKY